MLKKLTNFADGIRLKQLVAKRKHALLTCEELCAKQSNATIEDVDEKIVLQLRGKLQHTEQFIGELDRAIVEIQHRMDSERREEAERGLEEHAKTAAIFGIAKRKAAVAVDDALIALESAVSEYLDATLEEADASRMAMTGSGNVQPMIRLNYRLRSALWKWCPTFCKQTGVARLSAARWRSLADAHRNETTNPRAEKSA